MENLVKKKLKVCKKDWQIHILIELKQNIILEPLGTTLKDMMNFLTG